MDGIDGIAGVEAITVAACAAGLLILSGETALSIWILSLVFACLGFLVWNWPPAKIFMGDVGSGFLGVTLGGFALITSNQSELTVWTWLILLGVFLVDSTVTLVTRMARGAKWYEAHRSHAYQHLAIKYNSHKKVTIGVLIVNIAWLFPWAWLSVIYPGMGIVFVVVAYLPLIVVAIVNGAGRENLLVEAEGVDSSLRSE
jgi:Fuc2NAc and GlcNAc transferase